MVQEVKSGRNKPCIFPFTYQGGLHYKCSNEGLSKPWCPTQLNKGYPHNKLYIEDYIDTGKYGYCIADCPVEESDEDLIQDTNNKAVCSCNNYVDDLRQGKCQNVCVNRVFDHYGNMVYQNETICCYVNQPTSCNNVVLSSSHFGELSEQPCREENDEYLKYKDIGPGYCYPHISQHSNLLEAIQECKKDHTC